MTEQDDWLSKDFGKLYACHLDAFTRLMVVLRNEFDGDLDAMLVLSVIGERHFSARQGHQLQGMDSLGKTQADTDQRHLVNILSISEYTGIPRETVRRKVIELEKRGWILRDKCRGLVPTPQSASDLERGTLATIVYIRAIVEAGRESIMGARDPAFEPALKRRSSNRNLDGFVEIVSNSYAP